MIESAIIEDNALMNIEEDHYNNLFNGRLCPSINADNKKNRKEFPFQAMWELFVYAAVLGINTGRAKKINKQHKPFRWGNIGHSHKKNLLLLATAKNNSLEFLKDGDTVKKTIEEYANGGLAIINQEIKNNPSAYTSLEDLTHRFMEG
ncbi:hypothetical protein [Flavobacterium sp.]|uniref:hypothetical protein n=1 Tax=Flavobacterium sp. TaxID=239 RepID=UPI00391D3D9C